MRSAIVNGRVKGQVAVVTGAASGIGRACAKLLAAEGAAVAVTDVLEEDGQSLVDEICMAGGIAGYWFLDATNERQVEDVMGMVRKTFGLISVLVNNTGFSGANAQTIAVTPEQWARQVAESIESVVLCTKHALRQMTLQRKGSIVNFCSLNGTTELTEASPYIPSRDSVRMTTVSDAVRYAKYGVRVNAIQYSFIRIPTVENFLESSGGGLPLIGHLGDAGDIAYGVLYLASEESKFVTGVELVIDGGYSTTCSRGQTPDATEPNPVAPLNLVGPITSP